MLGDPKLSSVTRKNLQHVLDEVKADGRGVTANRILTHCKTFFDWCVTREHCQTSPTVGIKKPFKEQPKDRWLSDDEIKLFWAACYQVHETYGALGRLLLLTGQRLGEVASMRFEEIDDAVWSIPKEKTKNGKAHTVPLCDEAIRLIKDDRFAVRTSGFVVSKTGVNPMSNFSRAKVSIAKAMQNASGVDIEPWTFHDLRRTYATGMQRLGVVIPVTESLLNHVSGSRAGFVGVYQRYEYKEEKIEAAKKWSDHIISFVNNEE
jgi:integrase